jgi:hypothetical protein
MCPLFMSAPLEVIEYYVPRKGGRVIKGDVLLFISPTPFKGNRRGGLPTVFY